MGSLITRMTVLQVIATKRRKFPRGIRKRFFLLPRLVSPGAIEDSHNGLKSFGKHPTPGENCAQRGGIGAEKRKSEPPRAAALTCRDTYARLRGSSSSPPLMPRYLGLPQYEHDSAGKLGVLLVNLGTPDAPTSGAVRRFLAEFLWDPRVIETPRWLWWLILHGVILRVRPGKSAHAYQQI